MCKSALSEVKRITKIGQSTDTDLDVGGVLEYIQISNTGVKNLLTESLTKVASKD